VSLQTLCTNYVVAGTTVATARSSGNPRPRRPAGARRPRAGTWRPLAHRL